MANPKFPCLMLEKKNTLQNDYDKILNNFSIITNQEELEQQKRFYTDPVLSNDPQLMRNARNIERLFKPVN